MELRHLRYFVAVADHLSFTSAAKSLGLAQPPLSQQIKDLEKEIGTILFARTTRRVTLTRAGQDFYSHAVAILHKAEIATTRARNIGNGFAGTINIGLTGSMLAGPLSRAIRDFSSIYYDVDVRVHEMSPGMQVSALRSGQTDISFLRFPPEDRDLIAELAWEESVDLILPEGHALSDKNVSLIDLKAEKFVFLRLEDSLFARYLFNCCIIEGFIPILGHQVVEAASLISLVANKLGIALIPEHIGKLAHDRVIRKTIDGNKMHANVFAIRIEPGNVLVNNFMELLRNNIRNSY